MKDTGSYSKDAEMKEYPYFETAGDTRKEEYLKEVDHKNTKDVKKSKKINDQRVIPW